MSGSGHETTEQTPTAVPFVMDASTPNVARIYDYLLGGKDNFAADREAAEELMQLIPDSVTACRQNRRFLQHAVRFLARERGIRQFIDIGTGLPTRGNVHEVAQGITPEARVVYVDYDPVVVSHARALLATDPGVVAIQGDLRHLEEILGHPAVRELIHFDEPVAILLVAILHFITDAEDPYRIVATLTAAMPAGSYLVVSHITGDEVPEQTSKQAQGVYEQASAPVSPRSRAEIERFFDGLTFVGQSVADVGHWQAPYGLPTPSRTLFYAGVARKP